MRRNKSFLLLAIILFGSLYITLVHADTCRTWMPVYVNNINVMLPEWREGDSSGLCYALDNLEEGETIQTPVLQKTITGVVGDEVDTLSINGNSVSINPDGTFSYDLPLTEGENALVIKITHSNGSSISQTVKFTAVLFRPIAVDDTVITFNTTINVIDVLANDSHSTGTSEPLSIISTTLPLHGDVTFTSSTVTYTPGPTFTGTDTFDYTIVDSASNSDTATVSINRQRSADLVFPDANLASCIADIVSSNNWIYVDQITSINCSNQNIIKFHLGH